MSGLLLAVLLQAAAPAPPPPDVTASVDRTRLRVGEDVTLTVRARTRSMEPLEVVLPLLSGFALVGQRDETSVSLSGAGGPVRTSVRELQLRAERAGSVVIGPVRVRQGDRVVDTDPITLAIDSAAAGTAAALGPIARALLASARPPARADQVALTVIIPGDSVLVGQQLDVVAAAWFPRELRNRLRRAPVLTLETPEGVWAYPQPIPTEVAASRQIGGHWMDIYAVHAVLYPLAAGRVVIPPASVTYAVPASFSFFSREERYELRGDSVPLTVLALPAAGRPGDERGVVAESLALDVSVAAGQPRVGEPLDVVATLTGVGNVVLWPEPVIRWPPGFRAYAAETEVRPDAGTNGRVGGTKTFHYLVVPDSAGTFVLPEVRYPFFNLATGGYSMARAAARGLAVEPGVEPHAARALPPLAGHATEGWADQATRALDFWGWVALVVIPPLVWGLARAHRPSGDRAAAPAPDTPRMTRLGGLEREFLAMLRTYVPDAAARDGDGLATALRAAGVESAVADHVQRLRDRLRATRYGPHGVGDAAELAAEVDQVLKVLGVEPQERRRRRIVAAVALVVCLVPVGIYGAQGGGRVPGAEALYDAGALRAAADSFAARAAREPRIAAHWYNLGATLYRAGADGKAIAAWTKAARLAPRDPLIRRARRLLPPPDAASEPLLGVGIATGREWALVAVAGWLGLWGAALVRRGKMTLLVFALVAGAGLFNTASAWRRDGQAVAVVVHASTPVRMAPHGAATASNSVEPGAALVVVGRYGHWLAVRRQDGLQGWVLDSEVVPL